MIQRYKLHPIWELQPPTLMSYVEDLERQIREIEGGIYEFQLDLEVNLIRGRM